MAFLRRPEESCATKMGSSHRLAEMAGVTGNDNNSKEADLRVLRSQ